MIRSPLSKDGEIVLFIATDQCRDLERKALLSHIINEFDDDIREKLLIFIIHAVTCRADLLKFNSIQFNLIQFDSIQLNAVHHRTVFSPLSQSIIELFSPHSPSPS